jgi:hypothetical protein
VRSAIVRRFALVAVLVLLVPAWGSARSPVGDVEATASVLVRAANAGTLSAPDAAAPAAAINRQAAGILGLSGARADHRRIPVALALVALLALLRPAAPLRVLASRHAPSSLVRRRYAIALRAPPLPSCN